MSGVNININTTSYRNSNLSTSNYGNSIGVNSQNKSMVNKNSSWALSQSISKKQNTETVVEKLRKLLQGTRDETDIRNRILEDQKKYAQSLGTARVNNKNSTTEKKKVKYNFKTISNRIVKAKTSVSAKQVANQANREVQRLKKLEATNEYDSDELEAAINHAKSMERIAKKKANNLQQEEIAKAKMKSTSNENNNSLDTSLINEDTRSENKECESEENTDESEVVREDVLNEVPQEMIQEEIEIPDDVLLDYVEEDIETIDDILLDMTESLDEISSEMMDSINDIASEMVEEMNELLEEAVEAIKDIKPHDLKMMKIKHRNKENRDLVKADCKYLKAMFEHYEKENAKSSNDVGNNYSSGGEAQPISPIGNQSGGVNLDAALVSSSGSSSSEAINVHVDVVI